MFQPNRGKTGGGGPPQTGVPTSMQNQSCPSDMQAKEKLALYVYEYLMHSNAKGAAKLFLEEINWSNTKSIQVGDAPGFLQSWWSVFWDLYCAAPERRDTCEHSIDAKAFHDYGFVNSGTFPMVNGMHAQNAAPSPLGMAPGDGIMPPMGGGHPGYFPRPSQPGSAPSASQASPISGHPQPGFPGAGAGAPRYAPPSRGGGIRLQDPNMPPGFNGPPQHMFAGGHPDQLRPPPGMVHQQQQQQQRMPPNGPPGMRGVPTMNNFAMRPGGGAPMRWPQATPMHYGDSGAVGPYSAGPGMMSNGAMCSSTPASMMSSPGPMVPDGVAPDGRYMTMISSGPGMPPYSMVGGPDGPSGSTNDMLINGEDMKNSPASSAHGLNGGTPGPPSHQNNGAHGGGGPGSVHAGGGPVGCGPGSVHSQGNNNPNDTMDYANNPQQQGDEEQSEIAKIKQSIMEESGHFTEPKNEAADYCSYAPSL